MMVLTPLTSVEELIQQRYSCRTYSIKPLTDKIKEALLDYLNHLEKSEKSPFKGNIRFELLLLDEFDRKKKIRFGTYGFIKGANRFIIGVAKRTEKDLENFGFLFEKAILYATQLGLGTCWLGGTFRRGVFASNVDLSQNEFLPAISPLGFPSAHPSFRSKIIKRAARSKKRKDWLSLFFKGDLDSPLSSQMAGNYTIPLEMVRLAPSASNGQPWRVIMENEEVIFHFFIKRKSSLSRRIFSWPDFPRIDLGIAICHFDVTTKGMSLKGTWRIKKPDILIPKDYEYVISWFEDSTLDQ